MDMQLCKQDRLFCSTVLNDKKKFNLYQLYRRDPLLSDIKLGPMSPTAKNPYKGSVVAALPGVKARGMICSSCGAMILTDSSNCKLCNKKIDYDALSKEYEYRQYGKADHLVDRSKLPVLIKGDIFNIL